jgi:hypothetical protein
MRELQQMGATAFLDRTQVPQMPAAVKRQIVQIRVLGDQPSAVSFDEREIEILDRLSPIEALDPVTLLGERDRDVVGTRIGSAVGGPREVAESIPSRNEAIGRERKAR